MTEAEAKTKWCPFARVMLFQPQDGQNPAVNRETGNSNCIGSGCMAWEWTVEPGNKSFRYRAPGNNDSDLTAEGYRNEGPLSEEPGENNRYIRESPGEGRCGLAG